MSATVDKASRARKGDVRPVDPVALAQALVRCPSITPRDEGALDLVEAALTDLGGGDPEGAHAARIVGAPSAGTSVAPGSRS